jgi:hypothetical protein
VKQFTRRTGDHLLSMASMPQVEPWKKDLQQLRGRTAPAGLAAIEQFGKMP